MGVDNDGDFRLRNPDGLESGWALRKDFVYGAIPSATAAVASYGGAGPSNRQQQAGGGAYPQYRPQDVCSPANSAAIALQTDASDENVRHLSREYIRRSETPVDAL